MTIFTSPKAKKDTLYRCIIHADDEGFRELIRMTSRGIIFPVHRYIYSPEETVMKACFQYDNKNDRRGYSFFYHIETADGRRGYLIEEETDFSDARTKQFVKDIPGNRLLTLHSPSTWVQSLAAWF